MVTSRYYSTFMEEVLFSQDRNRSLPLVARQRFTVIFDYTRAGIQVPDADGGYFECNRTTVQS